MREFGCHEAASDDDQVPGQLRYPHDVVAGVIADPAVQDGRRDHRSRSRGDHHLLGDELLAVVGAQQVATVGLNRPETGMRVVDVELGSERR